MAYRCVAGKLSLWTCQLWLGGSRKKYNIYNSPTIERPMLRNEEQLQLLFKKSQEVQKRKKERELKRYRKAQESIKKELLKKKKKENKIQPPTKTKKIQPTNTIERETPENKLYSLFELQHIEELYPDEEGRICWTKWNELIRNFKNL